MVRKRDGLAYENELTSLIALFNSNQLTDSVSRDFVYVSVRQPNRHLPYSCTLFLAYHTFEPYDVLCQLSVLV